MAQAVARGHVAAFLKNQNNDITLTVESIAKAYGLFNQDEKTGGDAGAIPKPVVDSVLNPFAPDPSKEHEQVVAKLIGVEALWRDTAVAAITHFKYAK